jgi:drug/metabolite transporter (DMT)-like permease
VKSGYLTGLVSGVAWGLSGVIVGMAVAMAPFTSGVSLIAAPLAAAGLYDGLRMAWQCVPLVAQGRARLVLPALRTRAGGWAMLAALVGGPLATSCYFLSLVFSGVTYAYAVSALSPALGALLGVLFLRERLPGRALLGILLTIGGAVVVSYKAPAGAPPHFYAGIVLGLVCALAWAFEALFAAKAMKQLDAIVVNVVRQGLSFLAFVLVILPLTPGAYGVFGRAFGSPSLAVLAGASVVGATGYLLYFRAVQAVGPGRAMPINLTYVLYFRALQPAAHRSAAHVAAADRRRGDPGRHAAGGLGTPARRRGRRGADDRDRIAGGAGRGGRRRCGGAAAGPGRRGRAGAGVLDRKDLPGERSARRGPPPGAGVTLPSSRGRA